MEGELSYVKEKKEKSARYDVHVRYMVRTIGGSYRALTKLTP